MSSAPGERIGPISLADRRRVGAGVLIGVGALLFLLLVWLAFSLGFQRMRADLSIGSAATLLSPPAVEFVSEEQGWTMVRPGDGESGIGPEYGSVGGDIGAMCVFSWFVGSTDPDSGAVSDEEATRDLLASGGFTEGDSSLVRVQSESGQSIEFLAAPAEAEAGLASAAAARVFTGSGDSVLFMMKCDDAAALDRELLQETLRHVELTADLGA